MGKRYWSELDLLEDTYDWAQRVELDELRETVRSYKTLPLIAVGSGGSLSSAAFVTYLHRHSTGLLASAVTPLEIVHTPFDLRKCAVLFVTAGGSNPDIVGAFGQVAIREPARCGFLCTKYNSPLGKAARKFSAIDKFEFPLPTGKDGFLATNSLLATIVILARAYQTDEHSSAFPSLAEIAYQGQSTSTYIDRFAQESSQILERETLIALHGPSTHAAALDLESKFTEAALGHVQLADYRNFAHGRHHWLARHAETTGVVAFVTDELRQVAAKTVALIPSKIPTLQIELGSAGPEAAIGGIVNSLHLAGISGQRLDIDPGRPKVPEFGRKIYHLKAFPASRRRKAATEFNQPIAIDRKLEALAFSAQTNGELADWKRAYQSFIKMLTSKRYGALICDYDGTLCDPSERFSDPRMEILNLLNEMLAKSVLIGIVSGRGTSIRRVFQKGLKRSFWNRVTIGYYNGADIATLDDDSHPNNRPRAGRSLLSLSRILHADSQLVRFADIESREKQISVRPHFEWQSHFCWESVQTAIAQQKVRGIRALRSSHSIDVIAPGVSKRNLVEQVRSQIDDDSLQILCIGDKGRWPGNDSEFLLEPTSLSVDEVSSAPGTCWNLASPGKRHVDATVEYLSKMDMSDGFFSFHVQPKEKP